MKGTQLMLLGIMIGVIIGAFAESYAHIEETMATFLS
jgi:hypothetical protein